MKKVFSTILLLLSLFLFSCEEKKQSVLVVGDSLSKNEMMLNSLSLKHSSYRWLSGGQESATTAAAYSNLISYLNRGVDFQNVILWVGINDIWSGIDMSDTTKNFLLIKRFCRKHKKNLVVLTVPIYANGDKNKIDDIFALNAFIKSNFKEVDVNNTYVWLRKDTTFDGLHMNESGAYFISSYVSLIVFEKNKWIHPRKNLDLLGVFGINKKAN